MSKIAAIVALFMVAGLCVWFIILPFVSLTGYPPSDCMQVWYLPSPDYVSGGDASAMEAVVDEMVANGTYNETTLAEYVSSMDVVVNETFAGHFSLIGERKAGVAPPFFPALSQYYGYANYSRTGSDDRYLAGEWYFDDSEEFLQAEKELCRYLEEHGQVSTVKLTISEETKGFDATKYECETTSGYFLVYKNTFGREGDYFIVYYGAVGSVDLSNQTPFLKALIADRYPTGGRARSLPIHPSMGRIPTGHTTVTKEV